MATAPLVSIVVDNYNYARFLPRSVGSALAQTYPHVEVVVVDDASTDGSQEIIRAFGQRVTPVLKAVNAGHGAAFNSGFAASRGEIVIFLDADDYLYPQAVEIVVREFAPGVAKVQHRLDLVDAGGRIVDCSPRPKFNSTMATSSLCCSRRVGTRGPSPPGTRSPGTHSTPSYRSRRSASVRALTVTSALSRRSSAQ